MKQPDIEIYIKNVTAEQIIDWLSSSFDTIELNTLSDESLNDNKMLKGSANNSIPIVITPKAAGKAYTSVWFQSGDTQWANDLECASSFVSKFENEVRCSASTWSETEAENEEKWWCLSKGDRKLVRWG